MPTPFEHSQIMAYAESKGIECSVTAPQPFTSSVRADMPDRLVLKVNDPAKLPGLMQEITRINAETKNPVCASVIGGGRGGFNNSYSIGHIWDGTDVFIQLTSEPTIKKVEKTESKEEKAESKEATKDPKESAIFRVSPNMMLIELNKKLFDEGYHCPTLCGALPFMSLGGGLSTGSHTSFGYLADIVEGIELLLPNGNTIYLTKKDKDFDLLCNHPTLGLLGVITNIDIKVNKDKKKLRTTTTVSTYATFMDAVQDDAKRGNLESRSIIFSPISLQHDTPVKMTKWDWVGAETPDQGDAEEQIADNSFVSSKLVPKLAATSPKIVSHFFNQRKIISSPPVIAAADKIMGPDTQLVCKLTEVGVFFEYDEKKINDILKRLAEILKSKEAQEKFPVNTAIFIRFPRTSSGHKVVIDFASLGLNLPEMQPFINEFMSYLTASGCNPRAHYGKNHAIRFNQSSDPSVFGWEKLKEKYSQFYARHGLDTKSLKRKIEYLEMATPAPVATSYVDDEKARGLYVAHCEKYKNYLEKELDDYLIKHYPMLYNYYIRSNPLQRFNEFLKDYENISITHHENIQRIHEKSKMQSDTSLRETVKKYQIVLGLRATLDGPGNRIEAFHRKFDQERTQLQQSRSSNVLIWLGLFGAALVGLIVFSYWTVKAAHAGLNNTKANLMLIKPSDDIRAKVYQTPRCAR